jgi:uncharacterized surface protein with fasciclin (FAS1) repeats
MSGSGRKKNQEQIMRFNPLRLATLPLLALALVAPTDEAFAALPADVKAAQVVTLSKATSVLGKDVAIKVENGTIHVINAVLLPPAM